MSISSIPFMRQTLFISSLPDADLPCVRLKRHPMGNCPSSLSFSATRRGGNDTGESQFDLSVVNGMLIKLRGKLEKEAEAMEQAKARVDEDKKNRKVTEAKVDQLLNRAEKYDEASFEQKHLIIAALVERIEVKRNYEIHIKFKVYAEQFLAQENKIA